MNAVARDDAVGCPFVLDLEHDALVGLIGALEGFCDYPIQPGAFELLEPLFCQAVVSGRWGEIHGWPSFDKRLLEQRAALRERSCAVVFLAAGQEIEGDEGGRGLARQPGHPTRGGMDALLQHLELEPFTDYHHDFTIDDAAFRQVRFYRFDDLGEVAGHRLPVPRADLHLVAVAEDDRSNAVPLGFEAQWTIGDPRH